MEKKNLTEWLTSLGYQLVPGPSGTRISDRPLTKEEFDMILPSLKIEKIPDEYSLDEMSGENVTKFFRAAEQSLHTKSWKQLAEEMKGIAQYIEIKHKQNAEAKKKAGA